MTHRPCLLAASLSAVVGCGDFTPVESALVNPRDGGAGATYNGCTAEMFVDRTAPGAERTVGFGGDNGSGGFTFAPKCIVVAAGQAVTFTGAFASHPLARGVPGNPAAGAAGNPIPSTSSGAAVTVGFPRAGAYPYACGMHGFLGMNGVVLVR